ncbi:MAG: hypothetical protein AB7C90_00475 [Bacteroidales bacterium]
MISCLLSGWRTVTLTLLFSSLLFEIRAENHTSTSSSLQVNQSDLSRVEVYWDSLRQQILANGINLEGYHIGGGAEVMNPKFDYMLAELPSQLVRMGMPLKLWEPENENGNPDEIDIMRFNKSKEVLNTFQRISLLEKRGVGCWLSVWDVANWNVYNPLATAQRRVINIDEMAESIAAFLLHAREYYGVSPAYVSVNEPSIAYENGYGGYQIALTADEQMRLIAKSGSLFQKYGLTTQWVIALHKIHPSEIDQAKLIFDSPAAKPFVAGFDFHGYFMHTPESREMLKSWYEWANQTGLFTLCGECDYDNQFWLSPQRRSWNDAPKIYGQLLHNLLTIGGVNGVLPWYGYTPFDLNPFRFVSKHFMTAFPAGAQRVEAESGNPDILVTAAVLHKKPRFVLQNLSANPIEVEVGRLAGGTYQWISSQAEAFYRENAPVKSVNGVIRVVLPPNSLHTFSLL